MSVRKIGIVLTIFFLVGCSTPNQDVPEYRAGVCTPTATTFCEQPDADDVVGAVFQGFEAFMSWVVIPGL